MTEAASLSGKVVVIAGASSGIGRETAALFAERGAEVVMLARRAEKLEAAAAEIGSRAHPLQCDISTSESVARAFQDVGARFGRVDALLNVAGVARIRALEEASDEDVQYVVGVNLLGPIYTTRAAIPLMRAAGGGDIVNVSSEITLDFLPLMSLYGASKGGLDFFSRMMTRELKSDGIRVSLFVAGSTTSEFGVNFSPEEMERALPVWERDGYLRRIAGGKMETSWVAEALLFVVTRPRGQMLDVIHVRSAL